MKFVTCLALLFVVGTALANPMPQEAATATEETKVQEKVDESRFEIETVSSNNVKDVVDKDDEEEHPIGDLVGGLFGFLQGALGHVQKIAEDENVTKTVQSLLAAGANATGELLAAGGTLLSNAPQTLDRSGSVSDGLIKATDESQPILKKNLKELERFGDLFASFLRQYTDVAIKNLQQFLEVYDRRFKCHSQCKEKEGEARVLCDQLYCDGFDPEYFEFDEDLDYLVDTYGDLDELEREQLEKKLEKAEIKPRTNV